MPDFMTDLRDFLRQQSAAIGVITIVGVIGVVVRWLMRRPRIVSNVSHRHSQVKYVFTDVVRFTQNRDIEAQAKIIQVLNNAVREATVDLVPQDSRIFLATGDGICVAILDFKGSHDPEIRIALRILESIDRHNTSVKHDRKMQFQIRVGINQNMDVIIKDINGCQNVVGAGINDARRIMDKADGGQILVGRSIFDALQQHKEYQGLFRYYEARVKHDVRIDVYQFMDERYKVLNLKEPSSLIGS